MRTLIVACCCSLLSSFVAGAGNDTLQQDGYRRIGLLLNAGTIFVHSANVENTSDSRPFGFMLEYSKRLLGEKAWNNCHCYPTQGFLFGYTNYNNRVLGFGMHLAYFLEYPFLPYARITPVLRGSFGLSYGSQPWHSVRNPDNQSYSLPLNAFLQLQFGGDFRIFPSGLLTVRIEYNHVSNGGIKLPNSGINWPSVSLGYIHLVNYSEPPRRPRVPLDKAEKRWIRRIEVSASVSTREMETSRLLWIYGGMFTMARKIARLHTFSGAVEWHFSEVLQQEIHRVESSAGAHRAALLAGHDFLIGRFVFSQQIGIYLFDQFRYHDPLYHRWGLSYVHRTGVSVGISLKAHRHVAEFTDLRIGFHW